MAEKGQITLINGITAGGSIHATNQSEVNTAILNQLNKINQKLDLL